MAENESWMQMKKEVIAFLESISENAVVDVVIFAELMFLAAEQCEKEQGDLSRYIQVNRTWICLLMGCSRGVLKAGKAGDVEVSFAKLVAFMQGIFGGRMPAKC